MVSDGLIVRGLLTIIAAAGPALVLRRMHRAKGAVVTGYWKQLLVIVLSLLLVAAGLYAASNIGGPQPDRTDSAAGGV